jgi:hypothetical protein
MCVTRFDAAKIIDGGGEGRTIHEMASCVLVPLHAIFFQSDIRTALNDLPAEPYLVINPTELWTGSAFRFGTMESGSWR